MPVRTMGAVGVLGALALVVSVGGCGAKGPPGSTADPAPVPTTAVGPARLPRGLHPLARRELDQGPLDPGKRIEHLSMVFRPSPGQAADLEALRAAQLDPSSPQYHRWLTPEQYAARFGARGSDIDRASAWLASQGLEVTAISRLGTRVTFSGRVAQLESAFQAPMRWYKVGDELHYAMALAPAVPADLADVVLAIHNTHDFYPRPMLQRAAEAPLYDAPGVGLGLGPADWAAIYDATTLYTSGVGGTPIDGTGVTIAIVGISQIAPSDIDAFRTTFGLPPKNLTMTLVPDTGAASPTQSGAGVEAMLDIEWSGGIAKGAEVNYVFTGANDGNVDDATYYAIEENLAPILSESWGGCEYGFTPADADVLAVYGSAANVMGITYMASSGDSGAAGCIGGGPAGLYADIPAAYPGVTAVGGTEFPKGSLTYDGSGSVAGYGTAEYAWNENNNPSTGVGAGGGGISTVFARPPYQSGLPTCAIVGSLPTNVTPSSMRQVPDVAVSAAGRMNPYFVECTFAGGDCGASGGTPRIFGVGGTSASSPSFSGVVALVAQATGGRLGNINPLLYTLGTTTPAAFHDLSEGTNEVLCTYGVDPGCPSSGRYGYTAATGYDCTTGLGSIDAYNLVGAWASLAPTATTVAAAPASTVEGGSVVLTATVAVPTPNASALGGAVTFSFESYTADGGLDLSWTLGTGAVTGGAVAGGTATLQGAIPPGLVNPAAQYVDVVAMYGGDGAHLASTSGKTRITFGTVAFAVSPATATTTPGGHLTFITTGGVPPVRWYTGADATCDQNYNCSTLDAATGAFVGGPVPGQVSIFAVDSQGAEAQATALVASGVDAGAVDAGGGVRDAGAPDASTAGDASGGPEGGVDAAAAQAGTDGAPEAGPVDGGDAKTVTASGCGCSTAGSDASRLAPLSGLGLGLAALARRRERRR